MKNRKRKNSELHVGYYVVAFIDLLGQQERLRALTGLPNKQDPAQMDSFREVLKQTYGVVSIMRKNFQDFFDSFSKRQIEKSKLNQLTSEQKKQFHQMGGNPIQFQHFSDSTVIFTSLLTDRFKLSIRGIFGVLGAAGTSFLYQLARGYPIRGGVDIGVGMEIKKGEIYGAALAKAYALESKVAKYPRIVLGGEIVHYLKLTANQHPSDVFTGAAKEMAQYCLDMIAIDDDEHAFLDYLGEGFRQHLAEVLNVNVIKNAYENVTKQLEISRQNQDTKLELRYTQLRKYFEARLPLWFPDAGKTLQATPEKVNQPNDVRTDRDKE